MQKTWLVFGLCLLAGAIGGVLYLFTDFKGIGAITVLVAMVVAGMAIAIRLLLALFPQKKSASD